MRNIGITPLAEEKRFAIDTTEAAIQLSRSEQTLRLWACKGIGPVRPVRVGGRLMWPVSELKRLLGVA